MTIYFDFETRSFADIKVVGSYNYAHDPSTELICAVAVTEDGTEYRWHHGEEPPAELLALVAAGAKMVAHNSPFDSEVWRAFKLPPVTEWIDTLPYTRQASLPGSLDKACEYLFGEGKHEGGKLMMKLCKPHKSGRFLPLNKQNVGKVTEYCAKDVHLMKRLYQHLDFQEPEAVAVDAEINRRGFKFDMDLAMRLIECDAHNRQEMLDRCPVDADTLRSNKQLTEWLAEREVFVPNLQRATLEGLIEEGVDEVTQRVLEARIGATRITSAKVNRAIGLVCSDGRIRNHKTYWGAQTGRSASRGLNVANLPRGIKCDVDALRSEIMAGYQPNDMELSTMIRATIMGPLTVADYSQIEVRVLAWLAGEQHVLDTFRQGEDIYVKMAAKVFGISDDEVTGEQRTVGKVLILGCGYGLGANTFESYGSGFGIDFDTIGLTSQELVDAYRDAHPMIAGADTGRTYKEHKIREGGMWKEVHKAFKRVVDYQSDEEYVCRCILRREDANVLMVLPSGRFIRYRNVLMEDTIPSWGGDPKPTITYLHPRGYRTMLFPSKIAQNMCQAVARDLLYNGLINCQRRGIPVILDLYDEVVVEGYVGDRLSEAMTDLPEWAEGIPVEAEADEYRCYRK